MPKNFKEIAELTAELGAALRQARCGLCDKVTTRLCELIELSKVSFFFFLQLFLVSRFNHFSRFGTTLSALSFLLLPLLLLCSTSACVMAAFEPRLCSPIVELRRLESEKKKKMTMKKNC